MDTDILSSRQGTPQSSGQPQHLTQEQASRLGRVFIILALLLSMIGGTANNGRTGWQAALASPQAQTDLVGPPGSGKFGTTVTVLTNGNLVITDPRYSGGGNVWIGAVYLYDGETGERISMLTGSTYEDQISSGGVKALTNGNFVIYSPHWDYNATQIGAITWCSGTTGCSGVVSPANSLVGPGFEGVSIQDAVIPLSNGNYVVNCIFCDVGGVVDVGAVTWADGTTGIAGSPTAANSLVGTTVGDKVGIMGVTELPNGNYVVRSNVWTNGTINHAGAVTWCNGTTGCTGAVSPANSLVGSSADDAIGSGVSPLPNGNYVSVSMGWDNGSAVDAGAASFCSGVSGCTGIITADNSLVGGNSGDNVGFPYVVVLADGDYVVRSENWEYYGIAEHAGAVTWCSGTSGCTGVVSPANSLVGNWPDDHVGRTSIVPLTDGDYVVNSAERERYHEIGIYTWNQGASTWCNGTMGCTGVVSEFNSLVGSQRGDNVGAGAVALANGNYVVRSILWDNGGLVEAGAVTWCSGSSGCTGAITDANSLVGDHAYDYVGEIVKALTNGNYLVLSQAYHYGTAGFVGAVTWGSGTGGLTGYISPDNSLLGSTGYDRVGSWVIELNNGNYVVGSSSWDNGAVSDAGAVTWCAGESGCSGLVSSSNSLVGTLTNDWVGSNGFALANGNFVTSNPGWDNAGLADVGAITWMNGNTGLTGTISAANSLVGSSANDLLGINALLPLANGNYVIGSPNWDNGGITNAGAITWADGSTGMVGVVSAANSLVGGSAEDMVGSGRFTALANGKFIAQSPYWDNGAITNAQAVTLGSGSEPITGPITAANSVLGMLSTYPEDTHYIYNTVYDYLVVARTDENIVTIFPALPPSPVLYVDGALGADSSDCRNPSSPCQTIGYAHAHAVDGDTILVAAGVYPEILTISWPVTISGGYLHSGADWVVQSGETIIDAQQADTVITLEGGSSGTVLDHLTITNGYGAMVGGVDALNASLTIQNCTIRDNVGYDSESSIGGGGVAGAVSTNTLTILNSSILQNQINEGASGVRAHSGPLTMVNTLVADNSGDFAIHVNGPTDFMHVTVANNSDGILFNAGEVQHVMKNSIVWGNSIANAGTGTVSISYSDIQGGYAGTGNLDEDPLLVDPVGQDYHLRLGSPCIDAGNPTGAPADDLDGVLRDAAPDMGAYEWPGVRLFLSFIRKAVSP